jgi:anti-sigma B factor antagonist
VAGILARVLSGGPLERPSSRAVCRIHHAGSERPLRAEEEGYEMSMFVRDAGAGHWPPVELSVEEDLGPGGTTLRLAGELDMATARRLEAAVASALAREESALTVDLTDVSFMDSTGLRSLLRARRDCERRDRAFFLIPAANGGQHRLFQVSGLIGHLTFREPEAAQPSG